MYGYIQISFFSINLVPSHIHTHVYIPAKRVESHNLSLDTMEALFSKQLDTSCITFHTWLPSEQRRRYMMIHRLIELIDCNNNNTPLSKRTIPFSTPIIHFRTNMGSLKCSFSILSQLQHLVLTSRIQKPITPKRSLHNLKRQAITYKWKTQMILKGKKDIQRQI